MKKKIDSIMFSLIGNFKEVTMEDSSKIQLLKNKIINLDLYVAIERQVRLSIKIEPGKQPVPENISIRKPKLLKADESVRISFNDDRIDFYFSDRCKPEEAKQLCNQYYNMLLDVFSIKVNRIAINTDVICLDYNQDDANSVKDLFLKQNIDLYKQSNITSWQAMFETLINKEEYYVPVNAITSAIRGQISKGNEPRKDTILIHLDINTYYKEGSVLPPAKLRQMLLELFIVQDSLLNSLEVDVDYAL